MRARPARTTTALDWPVCWNSRVCSAGAAGGDAAARGLRLRGDRLRRQSRLCGRVAPDTGRPASSPHPGRAGCSAERPPSCISSALAPRWLSLSGRSSPWAPRLAPMPDLYLGDHVPSGAPLCARCCSPTRPTCAIPTATTRATGPGHSTRHSGLPRSGVHQQGERAATPAQRARRIRAPAGRGGPADEPQPYDLRRSMATYLLAAGINGRVVMEILGHCAGDGPEPKYFRAVGLCGQSPRTYGQGRPLMRGSTDGTPRGPA